MLDTMSYLRCDNKIVIRVHNCAIVGRSQWLMQLGCYTHRSSAPCIEAGPDGSCNSAVTRRSAVSCIGAGLDGSRDSVQV